MYFLCIGHTFRELFYLAILFTRRLISFLSFFSISYRDTKQNGPQGASMWMVWWAKITHWAMYWIDCCVTLRDRDSETKLKRRFFSLNSIWLSPVGTSRRSREVWLCALYRPRINGSCFPGNAFPSLMTFRFAFPFSSFPEDFPWRADWKRWWLPFVRMTALVLLCVCRMLPSLCLRRAELFVQEGKSFAPPFVSMDALSKPLESHQIDAHFTKMVPDLYRKRRDRREGRIIHFTFFSVPLFIFIHSI